MATLTIQEKIESALRHHQAGRLQQAEQLYREVLARQPDHVVAMHYLGVIAHQMKRHDVAVDLIGRAIALNPNYAEAHNNLGNALKESGRIEEAIASFRRVLALNDDSAAAHVNLGIALNDTGKLDEAIAEYRRAIALNPKLAEAHSNLGNALKTKGQLDDAIDAYRRAIAVKPELPGAHNNLASALKSQGDALKNQGQLDPAIVAYEQAVALKPDTPRLHNNFATALKDAGRLDEAVAAYRQAVALWPDEIVPHNNLIYTLHFHPGCDARAIAEEQRKWNWRHAEPLRPKVNNHANDRSPDRRLRVGYISPDLREHPVGRFLLPLLANHDHKSFEIFAYSAVPATLADGMTEHLRAQTDVWRGIEELSDAQTADLIRRDRIDILVDLSLHMAYNRLLVFARKPAPVQVTYLAYAGSSGLSTMDYRLSDPFLDPLDSAQGNVPPGGDESVYTEQTVRLAETYWCYQALANLPRLPPPVLANGFITFGCLNNFCKVNEPLLSLWASLLVTVPRSRLVLHASEGSHRQRVLEHLQQDGVEPRRVSFVGKVPAKSYFESYHSIDIALDTAPYGGGTTTCDALWMGVPVVSQAGNTAVGRGGLSILANIGLPELVADTPEEYVRIAAALAGDLPRLKELHATLRGRMQASPLMDAPRFARNIEAAYRRMWRTWCERAATNASIPEEPGSFYKTGVALREQGQLDAAIAAFRRAIALAPDYADAHADLGLALKDGGLLQEATVAFRRVIALRPDSAGAHNNLGLALVGLGQFDEALAELRKVVALRPSLPEAHLNLGAALRDSGRLDEAVAAYRKAIALRPHYAEAYGDLGNVLKDMGQLDDAIAAYRQALLLDPNHYQIHNNLVFTLLYHPGYGASVIAEELGRWNRQHAEPLRKFITPHTNDRSRDRRLRIGYVSADFRDHAVGRFLLPLLANHDHKSFEIFAYAHPPVFDAMTERLRGHTDCWRGIAGLSDAQTADLIRQDRIDILVDLTLHMAYSRLLVFARKPAPVQVSYLAYAGSSGLSTMDYRLSDSFLDPLDDARGRPFDSARGRPFDSARGRPFDSAQGNVPPGADESVYSEQTVRLPETYWCYLPMPGIAQRPPPALAKGFITFGCLNNFCKVNEPLLSMWARLLGIVPRSRLVLHAHLGSHRQRVLEQLHRQGIEPSRVSFMGKVPATAYFESYHSVDIALDTAPYGGGTTTCDALWMGVPVVSLAGTTAVGRGGLSILSNIGLPELVAHAPEDYVRIASGLAGDLPRLKELRSTLRRRMEASPLLDAPRFARNVEAAYRQMWRTWCEGEEPA